MLATEDVRAEHGRGGGAVGSEEQAWIDRAEREVTATLGAARADSGPKAAGVDARVDVVHAQTAYALVEASRTADLLILGHGRSFRGFGHLGGTARAVLRESICPVEIDPSVAPAFEGDAGATDGAMTADSRPVNLTGPPRLPDTVGAYSLGNPIDATRWARSGILA